MMIDEVYVEQCFIRRGSIHGWHYPNWRVMLRGGLYVCWMSQHSFGESVKSLDKPATHFALIQKHKGRAKWSVEVFERFHDLQIYADIAQACTYELSHVSARSYTNRIETLSQAHKDAVTVLKHFEGVEL